ncbi:MAG: hypothetical protein KC416_01490 [Myxococcales bacterium]|nr:hypothetical protein [Myxococcales bacterium]
MRHLLWIVPLAVALWELVAHVTIQQGVVTEEDWRRAAEVVKADVRPKDLIISAPEWTDPMLRLVLGDHISVAAAGRSDLAPFERVWALSIRGVDPEGAPPGEPAMDRQVGKIRVRRWDLGPSPVVYDFVEHALSAKVSLSVEGAFKPCPLEKMPKATGSGLGKGPAKPEHRFVCDRKRRWLDVVVTTIQDLDLEPRHCIWQRPPGQAPLRMVFDEVDSGDRLVVHSGLYYRHERHRTGADVRLRISSVDETGAETLIGSSVHRDGDGFVTQQYRLSNTAEPLRLAFDVSADHPKQRGFCWSGNVRRGDREP